MWLCVSEPLVLTSLRNSCLLRKSNRWPARARGDATMTAASLRARRGRGGLYRCDIHEARSAAMAAAATSASVSSTVVDRVCGAATAAAVSPPAVDAAEGDGDDRSSSFSSPLSVIMITLFDDVDLDVDLSDGGCSTCASLNSINDESFMLRSRSFLR